MSFSAATLRAALDSLTPKNATGFAVAASGGSDSAALLAAMAQLRAAPQVLPLRALHVDHGLQSAAADFRASCADECRRLQVPLQMLDAKVQVRARESIEAAARDARYAALGAALKPGECLLTAHHAEDQAETMLLQMLRGAGLKGMASMPSLRALGAGWHLRPLLAVSRKELKQYGSELGVLAIEDPMNADMRFDRNYLRREVWPRIEARWPSAGASLARSARHAAQAQGLIERAALPHLERLRDGEALSVQGLRALDEAERVAVIRLWLVEHFVEPPSEARLHEALRQVMNADASQQPAVHFSGRALRRYRHRLFLTAEAMPHIESDLEWAQPDVESLTLPGSLGRLQWTPQVGGLNPSCLSETLSVRGRRGGESIKTGAGRSHSVQHLCQDSGVLPWMRDALPFIFAGEELLAVGNLWLNANWCVAAGQRGVGIVWTDAPIIV